MNQVDGFGRLFSGVVVGCARSASPAVGLAFVSLLIICAGCGRSDSPEASAGAAASQPAAPKVSQDELNRGLLEAAAASDLNRATSLLKDGADANTTNPDGVSPLMLAAALGQLELAKALMGAGARLDATTTKQGASALMFAASFGRLEVANALVEAGANVKAVDASKHTAVDYTVMLNDGESQADKDRKIAVGKMLLSKGGTLTLTQDNFLGRVLSAGDANVLKDLMDRAKASK